MTPSPFSLVVTSTGSIAVIHQSAHPTLQAAAAAFQQVTERTTDLTGHGQADLLSAHGRALRVQVLLGGDNAGADGLSVKGEVIAERLILSDVAYLPGLLAEFDACYGTSRKTLPARSVHTVRETVLC